MKARLFWKTLFGFWLTYFAISQVVWLPFVLFRYNPYDDQMAERVGPAVLELCSEAIARAGPAACLANMARLQPDDRQRVAIQPIAASAATPGCSAPPALHARAPGPDGRDYLVCYHYSPAPPWPRYILHTPPEVWAIGAFGGFIFAAALAWYLIVPLQRIRRGFEKLAEGRLDTRVGEATSRRRDEVADLARDFDWMASHLQALVAARERLMHDVSHEFRSPLSRLQLSIALARQDNKRLPASLDRIEREAGRLNDLVNELLTLARVESRVSSDEYFDLAGLVDSVAADAEFEAKADGVRIDTRLPVADADAPNVRGSSVLIRRAIDNVIRNAIKFSKAGQTILVTLSFDSARAFYLLEVADEGPGVPSQALDHLFEPFVKAGERRDGFGLGLSIAKRALEAHGGRIHAENRLDGGFLVSIILPADHQGGAPGAGATDRAWRAPALTSSPPQPLPSA